MEHEVEKVLAPYAQKFNKICRERGWLRNWSNGGCYLHLEVSEFIESLRNKGGSSPSSEAGDIFFVFLAMIDEHKISLSETFVHLENKLKNLDTHPNIVNKNILHTGG